MTDHELVMGHEFVKLEGFSECKHCPLTEEVVNGVDDTRCVPFLLLAILKQLDLLIMRFS